MSNAASRDRQTDRHEGTGAEGPTSVATLIGARIAGRISRRGLIERAAALGIGGPVVGVMLHATSDYAFGRPRRVQEAAATPSGQPGRTLRADAPTRPGGSRRDGGTLTIGSIRNPDTLHPWLTQSIEGFDVLEGVMDGLLRYDSEQQLRPALAESFDVSDDGRTYTFALRQGVTFHNGDPFTAQDFEAAWRVKLSRAFGAYSTLGWDKIEDVEAPDEATLVVTTTEPYAPFLSYVGTTFLCPASAIREGVETFRETFGDAPIGTGPFRLAAREDGERIELERFDDYWGTRPRLDRIVYRIVPDADALLAGLRSGELQLVGGASALGADRVDAALAIDDVVVLEHPTQNWQHLDLKQIGFLRETEVRQALDFATPRERIVDELLAGRATPAFADQVPGTWAYHPTLEPRPFDPDRAASLLDEVGLVPGEDGIRARGGIPFAVELWGIAGDRLAGRIVDLIAAEWTALGVRTLPRFGDPATIWGPMGYQFNDRITAALYTWTNANDPDDLFYWHSSQIPTSPTAPGGNLPAFFYPYTFQEVIDTLTAEAATETDRDARRELYWQIQELLQREVPVIFLYWEAAFPVAAANLGGFWPSGFNQLLWNAQEWYLTDPVGSAPLGTPAATPVSSGPATGRS